ncbi:MAG: hypothetical protein P0Y65_11250 [Candidatus Devosia phytovorans]|uniref:CdiI immunity protein domain-containing protein n=1 Tax=Candidatus Devosia phytovorans TaxID=3121372 RepID=A0AAJ5VRG3_9HYPH|nr:hypothetical protein [Devosia sp.]WEK02785.1 MAG: hypothetical protein P0Y65_11250 [Devosia sp.]
MANDAPDAPASFWAIAMRFHQDVLDFVEAKDTALADYLVMGLSEEERRELAGFLDKVLILPNSGDRLLDLWRRSKADFGFTSAAHIDSLFGLIRRRL